MGTKPTALPILIGHTPAVIGTIDGEDPDRGPVDVAVVGGHVEVSFGATWAAFTENELLQHIVHLHRAWRAARVLRVAAATVDQAVSAAGKDI